MNKPSETQRALLSTAVRNLGRAGLPPLAETLPEKKPTKIALLIDLLERNEGATLDELVSATGWLPHTTRAALTGLRKRGREIARGKRGALTCYSIAVTA